MNNYMGDTRYEKVWEQMQLLGIEDITTKRQAKNGTRVWKLPIKNEWSGSFIEVASFKTGYVRNQNSAHSNYQLIKDVKVNQSIFQYGNGKTLVMAKRLTLKLINTENLLLVFVN